MRDAQAVHQTEVQGRWLEDVVKHAALRRSGPGRYLIRVAVAEAGLPSLAEYHAVGLISPMRFQASRPAIL